MQSAGFLICLALCSFSLRAQPALRWAADPNSNAPYSFYAQDNALAGFEYEIINAVARRLNRRADFVQNDWNGLIPGLHRGLYDCVICGIEITPDKAAEVNFSLPYYFTFEQFVSRRGTPPIVSLDQLRGRNIGTLDQTAALRMLENTPGVIAKTYDQELNAYQDIVNGRVFGVLLDYPIAKYYAAPNPDLQLSGPPFGRIAYGIAVEKGNVALQREIDAALRALIAGGELRAILSRWGLWTRYRGAGLRRACRTLGTRHRIPTVRGSSNLDRKTFGRDCKGTSLPDHFCGERAISHAHRFPDVHGGRRCWFSAGGLPSLWTIAGTVVRYGLHRSDARHSTSDSAAFHLLRTS